MKLKYKGLDGMDKKLDKTNTKTIIKIIEEKNQL